MIEITIPDAKELADFLSLLRDYMASDPAHAPGIAAHAKWWEERLREAMPE
jgi:hypothetical protein